MKNRLEKLKKTTLVVTTFLLYPFITAQTVYAQSDPSAEISAIIERVITIATRVGSGVLILFIIKDAFELLQGADNPMMRGKLARDAFFLVVAAIFLFKPDFILEAIKYIANV
ncbi:hypothetical protein KJ918_06160 [Patescibacteria group bacterium]|nr:hypothetical protein [Patescibacteria group bacterium]